jgi:hypothetical protein
MPLFTGPQACEFDAIGIIRSHKELDLKNLNPGLLQNSNRIFFLQK